MRAFRRRRSVRGSDARRDACDAPSGVLEPLRKVKSDSSVGGGAGLQAVGRGAVSESAFAKGIRRLRRGCAIAALVVLLKLPDAVIVRVLGAFLGGRRVSKEGVVLDAQTQVILQIGEAIGYDFARALDEDHVQARRVVNAGIAAKQKRPPAVRVTEAFIPRTSHVRLSHESAPPPTPPTPLGVRIYAPSVRKRAAAGTDSGAGAGLPALVYFHGGGWVVGNLDTVDGKLTWLAELSGCAIISVDYRLAPEHPFPAAFEDALLAFDWAHDVAKSYGWDPARILVGGCSAGGNMAAAVALHCAARKEGKEGKEGKGRAPMPTGQFLLYPSLNLTHITAAQAAMTSVGEFCDDPFWLLHAGLMRYFKDAYLPRPAAATDLRASPLFAPARALSPLPPAYFGLCHFDVLRDEAREYAQRMREAGCHVAVDEWNAHHAFEHDYAITRLAKRAIQRMASQLKALACSRPPALASKI